MHEAAYPHISYLARTVLCIQATSTESERLWSDAKFVTLQLRSALDDETAEACIKIIHNLKQYA